MFLSLQNDSISKVILSKSYNAQPLHVTFLLPCHFFQYHRATHFLHHCYLLVIYTYMLLACYIPSLTCSISIQYAPSHEKAKAAEPRTMASILVLMYRNVLCTFPCIWTQNWRVRIHTHIVGIMPTDCVCVLKGRRDTQLGTITWH